MAKITRDDVLKLARLARLELTAAEINEFSVEFEQILSYVEQLQNIDTSKLTPTNQVTGLKNVTRPDDVSSYGYDPKVLLQNVPQVQNDQIKVRRMIG